MIFNTLEQILIQFSFIIFFLVTLFSWVKITLYENKTISSKNNSEKITAILDTHSLVKNLSQNRVVQKIFENYQSKKFELAIAKQLPTIELDIFLIESSKKNLNALEDELFQLFSADYFTLASRKAKKDFTITIECKKMENLQVNGKISTKLESRIKITNTNKIIISKL